jgi:hypothetical protein
MTIHALVIGSDEEDIANKTAELEKSPDIVSVTMVSLSGVVKGWEISGNPE